MSRILQLIAKHNPFYLVSAASMLLGITLLTNSLSWVSIPLSQLLIMIVTLNVYEFAMLILARVLAKRAHLWYDARKLLVIQVFYLADITFLNAEIATSQPQLGVWINIGLWLLALVKLAIVYRIVRATLTPARFMLFAFQLLAIFALPCVFRSIDQGQLHPTDFYLAWWAMAFLPALYELVDRSDVLEMPTLSPVPAGFYLLMPWFSYAAHLGILHYVYDVRFYAADLAPSLIGIALLLGRTSGRVILRPADRRTLQLLLTLAAVVVSIPGAGKLKGELIAVYGLTPFQIALAASYVTFVYLFVRRFAPVLLSIGLACAISYLFGPSLAQVKQWLGLAWDWSGRVLDRITPKTATAWGVIGVISAFFFLTIGAVISLKRTEHDA